MPLLKLMTASLLVVLPLTDRPAAAATKDLGGGFADHGVASPISNHRGTVATVDGDGRNVVLAWLMDHRGGYALLMADAETGASEQIPMPFEPGDSPFASILSSGNRFYTHFNSHFVEFDPATRAFTFCQKTVPQMAMGMTEDDAGVIWSVTYPQSGVASFDPKTRAFKDYGHVYKQNWPQYQRYVAADDAGWVYFGVGNTASQLVAFDPASGRATPLLAEDQRKTGTGYVYRDLDGKVYGQGVRGDDGTWYELYKGSARKIDPGELPDPRRPKPIVTDSQGLFHATFPDGKTLKALDLLERKVRVEDPETKSVTEAPIEYTSEGAHIMGVAAAPDGTIAGGTAFPMRFFSFDPTADQWVNRKAYLQFNTVARQGDRFYFGGYTKGFLLEWDPARPWVDTVKGNPDSNPLFLVEGNPDIYRPHKLLAHPDGKTLVLAGTPAYGYTGGGLLFWDRESRTSSLLKHADLIPEHSTMSLLPLPDGKLLGGTTTSPGTGGEKKATEAELYVLDLATKKLDWHAVLFPGAQSYTDLHAGPDGLVLGVADRKTLFVFDPAKRTIVHQQDLSASVGPTSGGQGPRVFVRAPDGAIYLVLNKGIARLDPATYAVTLVAESPVPIDVGGDHLDGRIYFAHGSHLYSYDLDP